MVVAHVSLGRKIQLDTHIESHNHGTEEKREKKTRKSTSVILLKGTIECHKNTPKKSNQLKEKHHNVQSAALGCRFTSTEPLCITPVGAVITGRQSDRESARPRASQQFYGKS